MGGMDRGGAAARYEYFQSRRADRRLRPLARRLRQPYVHGGRYGLWRHAAAVQRNYGCPLLPWTGLCVRKRRRPALSLHVVGMRRADTAERPLMTLISSFPRFPLLRLPRQESGRPSLLRPELRRRWACHRRRGIREYPGRETVPRSAKENDIELCHIAKSGKGTRAHLSALCKISTAARLTFNRQFLAPCSYSFLSYVSS